MCRTEALTKLDRSVNYTYALAMGRRRTFDEGAVLSAVENSFWETGYCGTSLDDIMRVSGLGKGSLYTAFGDKYTIFRRVFDLYCARVAEATAVALAGPDRSALPRLAAMLRRAASRSARGEAQQACFLAKTTAELAALDPEVAARSRQAFEEIARNLVGCVEQAQRAGDIGSGADAQRLGHFILVVLRGIEALAQAGASRDVLRDAAAVAIETLASAGDPTPR